MSTSALRRRRCLFVQRSPTKLQGADQVVSEKVVGRIMKLLETEVDKSPLRHPLPLCRERPRLDRASGHQDVGDIREFEVPLAVRHLIAFEYHPHSR